MRTSASAQQSIIFLSSVADPGVGPGGALAQAEIWLAPVAPLFWQ